MQFKYFHDEAKQTIYRFPMVPQVSEQRDKKGRRIGWSVHMEIDITRADNRLINNRWEHPIVAYPRQDFDGRYSREEVVSYFHNHHDPDGEEIAEETYNILKKEYETAARERSSN